jgi:hypothetical protein
MANKNTHHLICKLLAVHIPHLAKQSGIYSSGFSRCKICAVFFSIPDVLCPCCNRILKRHATSRESKINNPIFNKKPLYPSRPQYTLDYFEWQQALATVTVKPKRIKLPPTEARTRQTQCSIKYQKRQRAFAVFWNNINKTCALNQIVC